MSKFSNLNMQKFSMLQPLYCLDCKENSSSVWVCKCDCGGYTHGNARDLLRRFKRSCGCMPKGQKPKTAIEHFNSKIKKGCKNGCWEWTGAISQYGYGVFTDQSGDYKKTWQAHRFSYHINVKDISEWEKELVCHSCDNRSCVNPEHLFLGTHQDNMDDMVAKGRKSRGEDVHNSKLMVKEVIKIKRLLETKILTDTEIAKIFDISPSVICNIKKGQLWGHIKT